MTIPANLAVALHPDFAYAAVDTGERGVMILARDLVESCMQHFKMSEYAIVADIAADQLENKRCRHPLYNRPSLIVLADHVTLDAGTGCVHTAPGHGREDYEVGLQYGLDAYSPVDAAGCFTKEAEFFTDQFEGGNRDPELFSRGGPFDHVPQRQFHHSGRCRSKGQAAVV